MAGGFHFMWLPVLFTCVVCTSDVLESLGISNENPDVAKIFSKITIPDGIDPSHINVTSITIKTCEGMKESLAKSQRQLQQMTHRYNQLAVESLGFKSEARQLKMQLATCMSTASPVAGTYQTHLQLRLNQMLEKLDPDTLLIFNIMTLTREVSTLEQKLKLAANSSKTAAEIREMQRQLEEKTTEQKAKIAEAKESFSSGTLILQIISLQNQIWDLQEAKSRGEKTGSQPSVDEIQVQHQLTRKIIQLQDKGDTNFASLLELIFVRSKIAELKRMISERIEKSKTIGEDARRQLKQKLDLLMEKILQLKEDKNNKTLTSEIMGLQNEVQHYEQLINNPQTITNSQIQELRTILDQEKQRQDVIQRQLEATEYAKAQLIIQIISIMEELKEQHLTGQPTTVTEAKEQEYAKALAKITELQRKLKLLTEMGSKSVERYEQMKTDFDQKIAELNRTEDIQAALILKLIKLHDELKALKEQVALSEDQDLTSELQRQLEKRQEELNSSIAHIESLTSSPGTISKIIELQNELWNLRNKAASGTRSNQEEELQDRLDGFIDEINNRAGENTKLILKIVTLQSQLEHLKLLLEKTYNSTSPNMLLKKEDLIEELTFKTTELQKYINELKAKNPSNAKLILATTDLYKSLKRIEKENHDDNATSSLTLSLLQIYLQNKNREYAIIKDKVAELERKLQLKPEECSGLEEQRDQLKTELEKKIVELNKTKDAETALILNVINLHAEQRALKEKISKAEDPEIILGLQRELEEKQDDLNAKIAQIKHLIANPRTIIKIIELQDEIWDLQNKDTNGTAGNQIRELQNRMDRFSSQIDSRDQENTKLTLKIMNLQSHVKHLQKLLSKHETLQTSKLSELKNELAATKAELEKQVTDLKVKDKENAKLILDIIDLQTVLENLETTASATISNLRTQLKSKEEEHSRDQEEIERLRLKLNETEDNCSVDEQTITTLQQNLTNKITELQSKSNSVTSLALKISTLNQELEQLKTQQSNSVSRSKVDELQKAIDEKNKELEELKKELKNRSTQPRRLLQIIALQTEIEKLVSVAQNDTDFAKIAAFQDKLNNLIRGIQDEENENTKLTFQILNQRDEIARLRKQQEQKNQTQAAKIKDLEDKLDFINKLIKEKSATLDTKGALILELETEKEQLEGVLSTLKENHIKSLAELQRRLSLKERQLEDVESQLESADSENFKNVMEIADLRAKLKQAETERSKASDKIIKELEKKLKTQERETKKFEAANKELERKLQLKTEECSGLEEQRDQLKTELEKKIVELNKTKDAETALILNVINLHAEQRALREKISKAEDPEIISGLQRELEEMQDDLNAKIAEIKHLIANPRTIIKIIELQDEIWDLQHKDTNGTAGNQIRELQNRMDRFISQIDSRDQENTKLTLKIMNLQSHVKHLQKLLSKHETLQTSKLSELKNELAATKAELEKQVTDLKVKDKENAKLILDIIDLQTVLENLETTASATISNLITQLKSKEEEHSRDQEEIERLRLKLNETEATCSVDEQTITTLQQNLTNKITELQSKSNSVTSLALKISTLNQELEQLKTQLSNSVSRSKVDELQKAIDEKNKELEELKQELKNRSTQPERLLQIIALQTEIEKLLSVVQNDTDFAKIADQQEKLNNLIKGLQNEDNENTKLIFQILNQRDEIARLRKQQEQKNRTQAAKIKDLEDKLDLIKKLIKEKSATLDTKGALILELETEKEQLEGVLSTLKENHIKSLAELQRRLSLKERQLEDVESQLESADSENFKNVMEIADLRAKLKQAETERSKASDKIIRELEKKLKTQERDTKKFETANKELERKLQLKTEECSGLEEQRDQLKTELEKKIVELNKTKDAETALILNVINLHAEQRALKEKISKAEDPEIISGLQRELEEMQDDLNAKIAEIKHLIANPRTIIKIIELQDEIWDLQNKDTNGTAGNQIRELQNRMDRFISQIDSRDQENTKLTLKIMNLQSHVKHLQKLLSKHETLQTSKLSELKNELAATKAELEKQVTDLKVKDKENAKLILDIIDLQTVLENLETTASATISNLITQLKSKEEEHSHDQEEIERLRLKLNETEATCSVDEQTITTLQQNLTNKITELQSKSNSVTSLALKISTLNQELEQLNTQLSNSVSRSKVDELQKAIDEKNKELEELKKELKNRSTQPERFLQIIALQTEIEKLVSVAQNDTDFTKIADQQEKLNNLIKGLQNEDNENTKLTFQILNQQDEIARLRKQQEQKNRTQAAKIKDLEDKLDFIKKLIKEKSATLDTKGALILELETEKEQLEGVLSTLKENHTKSLAELQRRLSLKERQLEDIESQLESADSENFKNVMEIADLRAKLKQAETERSKASDKIIKELEKKLKIQETETKKFEAANKDLTQEITELRACSNHVHGSCEDLQGDLQQCHEDQNRLQQQLDQNDARLDQLEQDLQRQIEEKIQLQDNFNDLRAERNRLEKEVEVLQTALDKIEEQTIHTSKMTFDPNTGHPRIALSADKTEMSTNKFLQRVPDNPERFDVILGVLGATGFSSGRHYWEVSVAGKTCYHLGMTSESSQRKGSPRFKPTNGYWTIVLDKQGWLKAIENRGSVIIPSETHPVRLGIMLDYKKGTICFYDSEARSHLYSFVDQGFTDRIYPFVNFCVEDGEAPTPIVLVNPGATDWIE
ncbi:centromere-associated protein E [Archocentrus centrarchus]|uniref:centromere-associated protein E n=1 Tax=Archocentrus centrarchus TaxID=63155 RepID=UPI0011E9E2A9|nr:centromere-associated protein E-like [Archocentrus centrarchus]